MLSKLIGSRKNRRKSASSLRVEVQQLEVRIVPAAGKAGAVAVAGKFSDPLVGSADFPAAKGNLRFRSDVLGVPVGSGNLTVTVENGPPGATVDVNVGGVAVGAIALAPGPVNPGNGTATFTIPTPVAGTPITVTTATGTLVLSGTFH